jgi:hypothetical protein
MSQTILNLGNGRESVTEDSVFTRLMNGQILDTEEVRYDSPADLRGSWAYVGVALAGSSPLDAVWSCIRRSFDGNGKRYRDQFRANIAWTDRANGWL